VLLTDLACMSTACDGSYRLITTHSSVRGLLSADAVQVGRELDSKCSCGVAQMAAPRASLNSLNDDVLRRILIQLPQNYRHDIN
jgi:hypothetical protein